MTAVPKPPFTIRQRKALKSKPHVIPWRIREEVIREADGTCAWCGVHGGRLDCHHRLPRSRGGKDDRQTLVAVHRLCHRHIHEHPVEAMARGFTVRSADDLRWSIVPAGGLAT